MAFTDLQGNAGRGLRPVARTGGRRDPNAGADGPGPAVPVAPGPARPVGP
jgi:hypothetical protein